MNSAATESQAMKADSSKLSSLPVRLIVFVVLIVVATCAIYLIDRRAMQRQIELEKQPTATSTIP